MSDDIQIPITIPGAELLRSVNSNLDEMHQKLAGLGGGRAGSALGNIKSEVKSLSDAFSAINGAGSTSLSELTKYRDRLDNALDEIRKVMAKNKRMTEGTKMTLGFDSDSVRIETDKLVEIITNSASATSEAIRRKAEREAAAIASAAAVNAAAVKTAAAVEVAALEAKAVAEQAALIAGGTHYSNYNANTIASKLENLRQATPTNYYENIEKQLKVDRTFTQALKDLEDKRLADQVAADNKSLAYWAKYNEGLLAAKMKEISILGKRVVAAAAINPSGEYSQLSNGLVVNPVAIAQAEQLALATKKVGQAHAETSPHVKKMAVDMNDAHSAARGLASGFNAMWLTWGNIVPLLAGAALSNAFTQSLKIGAEVAQNLAAIQHLAGASNAEMQKLDATVSALAASTQFGPVALTEALKVLSLAGLDATHAVQALIPVLNFSIAGEMPIAKAAESLVAITTAFGYEATHMSVVADIISKTAAVSMASTESMTESFRTASVVAQQYGVSLEDVSLNLAFLSQIGIKGTAAGTSMRNMYQQLMAGSRGAQDSLKALGVTMRDSEGNTKDLMSIVSQLHISLSLLTKAEQDMAIKRISNERGGKDIVAAWTAYRTKIVEVDVATLEHINTLKAEGKTEEANQIIRDNTISQMEKMKRAIADAPGFTAIKGAELSLTPANQYEGLKASLALDLEKAFVAASAAITITATKLRELFNSSEFKQGIQQLIEHVANFTLTLVNNISTIANGIEVFVAYKAVLLGYSVFSSLPVIFGAMVTAIEAFSLSTVYATTLSNALAAELGVVAVATKSASAAFLTAQTSLGIIGVILTGIGLAWMFFADHAESASEKAEKAAKASGAASKTYLESLLMSIDGYKDRAKAAKEGITVQEATAERELAVAIARIDSTYADTKATKENTYAFLENEQARLRAKGFSTASIDTKLSIAAKELLNIDYERNNLEAKTIAAHNEILRLARLEAIEAKAAAAAKKPPVGGDVLSNSQKAISDSLKGRIEELKAANALLDKTFAGEKAASAARIADRLDKEISDISAVTLAYTAAEQQRALAIQATQTAINLGKTSEAQGIVDIATAEASAYGLKKQELTDIHNIKQATFASDIQEVEALKQVEMEAMLAKIKNLGLAVIEAQKLSVLKKKDAESNASTKKAEGDLAALIEQYVNLGNSVKAVQDIRKKASTENAAFAATDAANAAKYVESINAQIVAVTKEIKTAQDMSDHRTMTARDIQLESILLAEDAAQIATKNYQVALEIGLSGEQLTAYANVANALTLVAQGKRKVLDVNMSVEADWWSAAVKAAKEYVESLENVAKDTGALTSKLFKGMEDSLMSWLDTGKSGFREFANSIINDITRIILRQAILKPLLNGLGIGSLLSSGAASAAEGIAAGGGDSSTGMLAGFMASASEFGAGVGASFMSTISGRVGMGELFSGGLAQMTAGEWAAGLATVSGPLIVIGLGIAALVAISRATSGEMRSGGGYVSNFGGTSVTDPNTGVVTQTSHTGAVRIGGPSGGDPWQAAAETAINSTVAGINATLHAVGSSATVIGFQAGYETSGDNRGGVRAGGTLSGGQTFGMSGVGDNYAGTMFDPAHSFNLDPKNVGAEFGLELQQAYIRALEAAGDLPKTIDNILRDANGNYIDAATLTAEQATALTTHIGTIVDGVTEFNAAVQLMPWEALKTYSFDAAAGLIAASGGLQQLGTNLGTFYSEFYTPAEQLAQTNTNIASGLTAAGHTTSAADVAGMSRDDWRAMVEASMLDTSEAGIKFTATLLRLSGAFSSTHQVIKDVTSDFNRAMLEATGNSSGLAAFDKAAKDAALIAAGWTQAQVDQVHSAQATTAAAKVTSDFNRAMLEATGNSSGLAAFDKAAKDAALIAAGWTQAQVDQVHSAEATTAAAKVTSDFNRAMLEATGNSSGLAAFDKAAKDAALIADGWTQAQVDQLHSAEATTAAAKVTSDFNRAMLEATGNSSGLAAFDKAAKDAALIADGWTQAQVDQLHSAEATTAAAKVTSDFNRAMLEATGNSSGLAAFDKAAKDAALIAAGWTQAQVDQLHSAEATTAATKITGDFNRAMLQATGNSSGLAAFDKAAKDAALIAAGWTQAQVDSLNTATAQHNAAKEFTGFDAAGLGKMMLDAAFNPQAGMTAAESFGAALQSSVENALISSTVGSIAESIYNSIIVPIVAGAAVSEATSAAVLADAQTKLASLGAFLSSSVFKDFITTAIATVGPVLSGLTNNFSSHIARSASSSGITSASSVAKQASNVYQNILDETAKFVADLAHVGESSYAAALRKIHEGAAVKTTELQGVDVMAYRQSLRAKALATLENSAHDDAAFSAYYAALAAARTATIDVTAAVNDWTQAQISLLAAQTQLSITDKYKAPQSAADAAAALASSGLDTSGLANMGAAAQTAWFAAIAAAADPTTAAGQALIEMLSGLTGAMDIVIAQTKQYESTLDSVKETYDSLSVDLLKAQGNDAGALALQRQQELAAATTGLTDTQAAAVAAALGLNWAMQDQITQLTAYKSAMDGQLKSQDDLQVQLLKAQGNDAGALALQRQQEEAAAMLAATTAGLTQEQKDAILAAMGLTYVMQDELSHLTERKDLQDQLNGLTDTAAEALARQREAIDESNRALWDQVQAEKARQAILATNAPLQGQLDVLLGNKTQKEVDRAKVLADIEKGMGVTTDATTLTLQLQIWAQQDLAEAAQKSIEAMKKISDEMKQIAAFKESIGGSIQTVRSQVKGYDPIAYQAGQITKYTSAMNAATTTQGRLDNAGKLKDAIMGSYDAQLAAINKNRDAAVAAQQAAFDAETQRMNAAISSQNALNAAYRQIGDYAKGLLTGANSPFSGASLQTVLTASYKELLSGSRAGDIVSLGKLTGAADTMLGNARTQAVDSVDYARTFGRTLNELSALGGKAGTDLESITRQFVADTSIYDAQALKLQDATIQQLQDLSDLTDAWTADLQDSLDAEAVIFAGMGLNLSQIDGYLSGLGSGFDSVVSAINSQRILPPVTEQPYTPVPVPEPLLARFASNSANDALVVEIKALRAEVAGLRKSSEATAQNTAATASTLDSATGGGGPMLVTTA